MIFKERIKKHLEVPIRDLLERVEPFFNQTRMRVIKLQTNKVEIKIFHNVLTQSYRNPNQLDPSQVISLAFQGFYLLLDQNKKDFLFHHLSKFQIEWFSEIGLYEHLKFKLQFPNPEKDKIISQLNQEQQPVSLTLTGFFYSSSDQLVGQTYWDFQVQSTQKLQ